MRIFLTFVLVLAFVAWVVPSAAYADNTPRAAEPVVTMVAEYSDTIGGYYDHGIGMVCSPVVQFRDELVADGIPADSLVGVSRVCEPAVLGGLGF